LGHTGPGASTQPFTYVGAYGVRTEGSLYQMGLRYYDPVTARFLSRDPLPPDLTTPESLNPYQYAYNNPLAYLDPEGTSPRRRSRPRMGPPSESEIRELRDGKARRRAERLRDEQIARLNELNAALHGDAISKPGATGGKSAGDLIGSAVGLADGDSGSDDFVSEDPGIISGPLDPIEGGDGNDFIGGDAPPSIPISDETGGAPVGPAGPAVVVRTLTPEEIAVRNSLYALDAHLQQAILGLQGAFFQPGANQRAIRDAISNLEKQRAAVGAQIKALGGTPPDSIH
ncbi:MAG: RHS repeat-associated core domain-containing protein, partial [Prosthecobacter sp.]|nr:RHS repeat-associated core domain-containing protein [Prosthecobacter sp.]